MTSPLRGLARRTPIDTSKRVLDASKRVRDASKRVLDASKWPFTRRK